VLKFSAQCSPFPRRASSTAPFMTESVWLVYSRWVWTGALFAQPFASLWRLGRSWSHLCFSP